MEHDYTILYQDFNVYLYPTSIYILYPTCESSPGKHGRKLGSLVSFHFPNSWHIAISSALQMEANISWSCLAFDLLILLDFLKDFLRNENMCIYIYIPCRFPKEWISQWDNA